VTGRRVVAGVAVAVGAVALVVLPGLGDDPLTSGPGSLERLLDSHESSGAQRPTLETVQGLAAELSDTSGDQPIDPDRVSAVMTSPGPYAVLAQLQIPAIGLDVEVGNGVDPDTLALGPGHWPGTPVPGRVGNAVLSGHRTTHSAPFRELDELTAGDEITVSTQPGVTTTYVVTEVLVVPVEEYTSEVLAQPEDGSVRELTLFACHPEGSLSHRIVVRAQAPPA
jgi:sortase A